MFIYYSVLKLNTMSVRLVFLTVLYKMCYNCPGVNKCVNPKKNFYIYKRNLTLVAKETLFSGLSFLNMRKRKSKYKYLSVESLELQFFCPSVCILV